MNALLKLIDCGQSYWMDNLTRSIIKGGELEKRVTEQGLRGITSNPAIFNKAISKSDDYDEQIKELVGQNLPVQEIYEALVVKDIQDACDILLQVYDKSAGLDGFVSLEVSPYLAHNTRGTIAEARRLFKAVARPNCFIKIPGTLAGLTAIEQMLYEGVNINITLLFSVKRYESVAQAYICALQRRMEEGKPLKNISSVTSFFLSRIDVLTDQLLGHLIISPWSQGDSPRAESLLGKAAIASAKLAYQSFKRIFGSDSWKVLAEKGARVQRPLWASTSTKDPLYRDVKYVEPLIGRYTVNTMPEETITAFAEHGVIEENSVEKDLDQGRQIFFDLEEVGVDIDFVTNQLVNEGVQKFIDPYDELMKNLANKRQQLLADRTGKQTISFGPSKSEATSALSSLNSKQYMRRLMGKDPFLWKSDAVQVASIRNRLGWLTSIEDFQKKEAELTRFAQEIKDAQFSRVVLLGMGGSSLCPEVSQQTFGSVPGFPNLLVLDSTDPAAVKSVESQIASSKTLFVVSSKSGTTTETICFYRYFYELASRTLGSRAGEHFIAITDAGSPLAEEAVSKNFRRIFENPVDIGGRYSALSYFGLVPMALIGIDIRELLEKARQMQLACGPFIPPESNQAVSLGTFLGINQRQGRDKVTLVLSKSLNAFGYWLEQLLAESTGKEGVGLVPVEGEPLGLPGVYGRDRVFIHLFTKNDSDQTDEKRLTALEEAGHPVVRIELRDQLALGAEYLRWELATATAGAVLGVNPFDEPNVDESKKNTQVLLGEWKQKSSFSEGGPFIRDGEISLYCQEPPSGFAGGGKSLLDDFLNDFVSLAKVQDYIGVLAYFQQTPARHRILQAIRLKLRDRLKCATTLGCGPRYLHSTGQLHKGGADKGVFLMLTADPEEEVPIPGEDYGFATLLRAQALGDFRSLSDKRRRIVRIHLGREIEAGLIKLNEKLR